jgi:uncharacterized protein (TIGR03790 family)
MIRLSSFSTALLFCPALFFPTLAFAVPAPDSVAVLANASMPGSVALAERYARLRAIPDRQVCLVSMPSTDDISLANFNTQIREPLERCLENAGVIDRIESIVIARGVPLRVTIDVEGTQRSASVAAALGLWRTTMEDGSPLLGRDPGSMETDCGGTPCWGAAWPNPYRAVPFSAGWERTVNGVTHRPVLVTMLHGRSDADAERLLDSALEAEALGAEGMRASGEFLFMDGSDPARAVRDNEYYATIADLRSQGFTATRVPFDRELAGRTLAGFFTGSASLGNVIEGNEFHPGALVDNLTSLGAVPENFRETGEAQVSIARWVARGVAGVHGTTSEPLNNCFPSRWLIADYTVGATLAEAYWGRMPFVYWQNLVLGDPMAAPYADRPVVEIEGMTDGAMITAGTPISMTATPASDRTVESITLYIDGVRVSETTDATLDFCLVGPVGDDVQVLAIANAPGDETRWPARGWASMRIHITPGNDDCASTEGVDGGVSIADSGTSRDASAMMSRPGGSCGVGAHTPRMPVTMLLAALGLVWRLRGAARRRNKPSFTPLSKIR